MTRAEFHAAYTELMEQAPRDLRPANTGEVCWIGDSCDLSYCRENGDWIEEWLLSRRDLWGLTLTLLRGLWAGCWRRCRWTGRG